MTHHDMVNALPEVLFLVCHSAPTFLAPAFTPKWGRGVTSDEIEGEGESTDAVVEDGGADAGCRGDAERGLVASGEGIYGSGGCGGSAGSSPPPPTAAAAKRKGEGAAGHRSVHTLLEIRYLFPYWIGTIVGSAGLSK